MIDYRKEEVLLTAEGISMKFDETQVLHDINIQIRNITRPGMTQGQIVAICGRSGCGKSTLFNILTGYIKPTTGRVLIGEDQHPVRLGEMGMVTQKYVIFDHRTVFDNLAIAISETGGRSKKEIIEEYTRHFDLFEQLEKYPCDISGGQRQRVAILQQVLAGNRFILLDEPFSGLDIIMKDRVIDLLVRISNLDEKSTLVIVSHDYESSCAIADTVIILANQGQGSTSVKTYDFLEMGLAYTPDIKENPEFRRVMKEIKTLL